MPKVEYWEEELLPNQPCWLQEDALAPECSMIKIEEIISIMFKSNFQIISSKIFLICQTKYKQINLDCLSSSIQPRREMKKVIDGSPCKNINSNLHQVHLIQANCWHILKERNLWVPKVNSDLQNVLHDIYKTVHWKLLHYNLHLF